MSFIVFDTEDNSKELMTAGLSGFDKKVTQIAAIKRNGNRYYNKGDGPKFLKWLGQQKERFIYAHNLQYDLGNLFGGNLDVLDITDIDGRMIKAVWHDKIFVDSFNIYVVALKVLGEAFGLEKLETDSMATDKEYVYRDCEIIHAGLTFAWDFIEQMGLEALPATAGGICFSLWKKCMDGENCHDSLEISRLAYYGGRVELFKMASESQFIGWTDINSLYPFALQNWFPGPLEDYGKDLAPWGIATIDIQVPETDLAVLPWRSPKDGRILYPWGKFSGTWTMAEINEAVKSGAKILKVKASYGSESAMQPYAQAMQTFYAARLQSESGAQREFFKRMMNAFYGRLGSKGEIGRSVVRSEKTEKLGIAYGKKVHVKYKLPLSEETNWSHAAYVTAYGRLELLKYLRLIGPEKMIYCDTDSCIFEAHPQFNMQFSEQPKPSTTTCARASIPFDCNRDLGAMKLEGWEQNCRVWAPKMYNVGKRWKAKGVPQRLARQFIESGHVEYDLPYKFREAITFYDRGNAKKLSVWRRVEKRIKSQYDKKTCHGNRFYPCKVNDISP